jgi:hypothetical protein
VCRSYLSRVAVVEPKKAMDQQKGAHEQQIRLVVMLFMSARKDVARTKNLEMGLLVHSRPSLIGHSLESARDGACTQC